MRVGYGSVVEYTRSLGSWALFLVLEELGVWSGDWCIGGCGYGV